MESPEICKGKATEKAASPRTGIKSALKMSYCEEGVMSLQTQSLYSRERAIALAKNGLESQAVVLVEQVASQPSLNFLHRLQPGYHPFIILRPFRLHVPV